MLGEASAGASCVTSAGLSWALAAQLAFVVGAVLYIPSAAPLRLGYGLGIQPARTIGQILPGRRSHRSSIRTLRAKPVQASLRWPIDTTRWQGQTWVSQIGALRWQGQPWVSLIGTPRWQGETCGSLGHLRQVVAAVTSFVRTACSPGVGPRAWGEERRRTLTRRCEGVMLRRRPILWRRGLRGVRQAAPRRHPPEIAIGPRNTQIHGSRSHAHPLGESPSRP
jgi:hypothetical protein